MARRLRTLTLLIVLSAVFSSASFCVLENPVPGKITKVIIKYLISKDPNLEGKKMDVSYKYADRTFKELKYRSGNVSFEVAELYPDFKPLGNVIVPIQVIVDGVEKEKLFLRTKVSVFDKIVVAKKRLKRGDLLDGDAIALEERDIAALSTAVIRDDSLALGKEAKTFIPQGNAVYEWMIKDRPMVKKEDKVNVIAGSQNLTVNAKGISLDDGLMGQTIRIKNPVSGKEFTAVVTGTEEVTVR